MSRACCCVLVALAAFGAAEGAELHLRDGSVVIGKILRLTNGEDLVLDTAHMGEVVVAWGAVERLRQEELLDVELFDGRRLVGQLQRDGEAVAVRGESAVQVSAAEVFWIEQYSESFLEGLTIDTDLGMNLVRGNSRVTQISSGIGLAYDDQSYEVSLRGTTIVNEQADTQDTRRTTLNGAYTHKYSRGWQVLGTLQYEADEQQDLEGRTLLGAALGKRVYNERQHRLELFAGMAVNAERFEGLARAETLEALLGGRYRMRTLADLDATLLVLSDVEDVGRVRVQFDATVDFDLFGNLDLRVTLYDRYDSRPPAGNTENDFGTTLGLNWSY